MELLGQGQELATERVAIAKRKGPGPVPPLCALPVRNETELHDAARAGDIEGIHDFEGDSALVQGRNWKGRTALFVAVGTSQPLPVIEALMAIGSDATAPDKTRKSSLHKALERESLETVEFLLARGADASWPDEDGRTPLHFATAKDMATVFIELLVKAGSDVNAITHDKRTALMLACTEGNVEVATILLKAGADPNALDSKHNTALHAAVRCCAAARQGGPPSCPRCERTTRVSCRSFLCDKCRSKGVGYHFFCGPCNYDFCTECEPVGACASLVPMERGVDLVRRLMEFGADASIRNKDGRTAASLLAGEDPVAALLARESASRSCGRSGGSGRVDGNSDQEDAAGREPRELDEEVRDDAEGSGDGS
jgi:hypothetical protein